MKINDQEVFIVTPWHNEGQLDAFRAAWGGTPSDIFILQRDETKAGCARTKNAGIRAAMERGADVVIILDDDCYPAGDTVQSFIAGHLEALRPAAVPMFQQVTTPASRGTPYHTRTLTMPVAAAMGFWLGVGDYDAPAQLVHGPRREMEFFRDPIHGKYFPLCGMNLSFRPKDWWPWCAFIDVPRFDDIWQGFLWEHEAYERRYCFNLGAPLVTHARQSNVWANLRDEAPNLERNETIWQEVHFAPALDHAALLDHLGLPAV